LGEDQRMVQRERSCGKPPESLARHGFPEITFY